MSISPLNFNGMIQNTNEVSHTHSAEDQKPLLQQENLTHEVDKQQEQQAKQVNNLYKSEQSESKYDREGSGKGYQRNKNRKPTNPKDKKEETEMTADGKIFQKPSSSFDMRV